MMSDFPIPINRRYLLILATVVDFDGQDNVVFFFYIHTVHLDIIRVVFIYQLMHK